VREMFKHEDFQFGYEIALGSAYRGYAEVGEVLSTAGRIKDGDADQWVREWCATAERLDAAAQEAEAAGRRVSARGLFLRASSYFSTGLYLITHSGAPGRSSTSGSGTGPAGTSWSTWPRCPESGSRSPTRAPPCPATSSAPPAPLPASGGRWWS
jgi:hypothetical protein